MTKLTDKIEEFIKNSISEKRFVFLTEEIDKQVRLFLKKEKYLKSPLK